MRDFEKKQKKLIEKKEQKQEWRDFIAKVFIDAEEDHAGEMHFINLKNEILLSAFKEQKEYINSLDKKEFKEFKESLIKKIAQEFTDSLTTPEVEFYAKINDMVADYKSISYPEKLIPKLEELKIELESLCESLSHETEFAYEAHSEIKKLKDEAEKIIKEAKEKGREEKKTLQTIQSETHNKILPICLKIQEIKRKSQSFKKFEFREIFLAYIKTEINLWINLEFRRSTWSDK
ncbi:MAG: hypothetical protein AAB397_03350 [Patescibacteria group bacterium]